MSEHSASPRTKLRIENLSDLVFGLALSIGSIALISNLPQKPGELVMGIVIFGASFLLVVWIWTGYTTIVTALPYEVAGSFVLNIALLFCVAVEPYLFYVQQEAQHSFSEFSSSIYALDVGAMLLILAGLAHVLLIEEKKQGSPNLSPYRQKRLMRVRHAQAIVGIAFIASALPLFWVPVPLGQFLRYDMFYVLIAILLIFPRLPEGRPPQPKAPGESSPRTISPS